ncbi:MAG: cryptochrome/photolyase family protein [Ignavibacteriaceae bacterium]|nr:cryptochrome/photolyase family protein [Ignavibacteriaceae bacterium]
MNEAVLIFPHQLFKEHPALDTKRKIFLLEDPLFFGDIHYPLKFHKKKLIFHRASMRFYADYLREKGHDVFYLQYSSFKSDLRKNYLTILFNKVGFHTIHYADVTDFILEKRIRKMASELSKKLIKHPTPMFLSDEKFINDFFSGRKSYLMASFYTEQRKRLNILMNNGKPVGGKWNFDEENRKKLPKGFKAPGLKFPADSDYEVEAIEYIEKHFPENPGDGFDFIYPVTFEQAENWLDEFLANRLKLFGDYEDAIDKEEAFLFHSVLTPLLNSGLLTPRSVLDRTLDFAKKNKVPLNSLEGFIRQIIGWREYMRAVYLLDGVKMRTTNFWQFQRKMPSALYSGETGILPVDSVIKRLLEKSYTHHIERLMILGNFMLLCEIHPDEVYKWFMEMYIDSYDWVMVPNVYGMSQYADGGLICTKPYISSSNYILKMSNYEKGEWCKIWDALYWHFIYKHKNVFKKNPRTKMMILQLDRMEKSKLKIHLNIAQSFLSSIK